MVTPAATCLSWRSYPTRMIRIALSMFIAMAAAGCGGGGGGDGAAPSTTVALSGVISAPDGVSIDGDVNDPNEAYAANDTFVTAQLLANPVSLGGDVNEAATGAAGRSYAAYNGTSMATPTSPAWWP